METAKRTPTGSFIATCTGGCGKVTVADRHARHSCGAWVVGGTPIKARVTETECGPKCTSALGPVCDCSCGGENHAADHAA